MGAGTEAQWKSMSAVCYVEGPSSRPLTRPHLSSRSAYEVHLTHDTWVASEV